jgi:hypothetical protein
MTTRPTHYDAIDTMRSMGYTDRQATFMYTAAVHSGYFLRRQFNFSIQRHRGCLAADFLAKAKRAGHVREIQCTPGRLLYHICAKQIYRLVGIPNSASRGAKSSREVRRRLIMLDYVLARLGKEQFLDSERSRRAYFTQFGIKDDALNSARKFGDMLPISLRPGEKRHTILFPFVDEGQRSIAKFERFLSTHDRLLCSLSAFEVVYVATSPQLFKDAQRLFQKLFPTNTAAQTKNWTVAHGDVEPLIPQAGLTFELMKDRYPSFLGSDPVCHAVWYQQRCSEQKSLFSTEMTNETV